MATAVRRFLLLFRQWPAILAAACVLAVDVFDSFGLDQAADEQAARIVGTIAAPFYGASPRRGQSAVTVVLIDDASIDQMNWPTPLPYDQQADIVAAIAQYEPAAIFLDLSYLRPHDDDPAVAIGNFSHRLRGQMVDGVPPIMIGDVAADPIFDPLREIESVGVRWRESSWLNYPLQDENGRPMAAVALYNAWCAQHSGECRPNWSPPQHGAGEQAERLSLTWGFGGSPLAADFNGLPAGDTCTLDSADFGSRLAASARQSFGGLGRALINDQNRQAHERITGGDDAGDDRAPADAAEARCIYTDTMNASTLLLSDNYEALESMLKGRVVLVGASHRQSADLITIPHIGVVPGVYIHAMATDNLIEQGPEFLRPPPDGLLALDFADIVEMLLSLGLFAMAFFMLRAIDARQPGESEQARTSRRRLMLGGAFVLAVLFVLVAAFIEHALHWPPLNVLGVIVLVASISSYLERGQKPVAHDESAARS